MLGNSPECGPHDDQRVRNWVLFNLGMDRFSSLQLTVDESTWVMQTNREWHGDSSEYVESVIRDLQEQGSIQFFGDSFELLELTDKGAIEWERTFNPTYDLSYTWEMSDPSHREFDCSVEICAVNFETVLRIIVRDINIGIYNLVDPRSLLIRHQTLFKPLYWSKALVGIMLRFDAIRLDAAYATWPSDLRIIDATSSPKWHDKYCPK